MQDCENEDLIQIAAINSNNHLAKHLAKDITLEVKQKSRRGKCLGAPGSKNIKTNCQSNCADLQKPLPQEYQQINDFIWYRISEFVEPTEVLNFALICRQTAAIVASRHFWKVIYEKYCKKAYSATYDNKLIEYANAIETSGAQEIRHFVIRSLFICHKPLVYPERIYGLETLFGYTHVRAFYVKSNNISIICIKFVKRIPYTDSDTSDNEKDQVEDWEELAHIDIHRKRIKSKSIATVNRFISASNKFISPNDGEKLLVIGCYETSNPLYYDLNDNYENWRLCSYRIKLMDSMVRNELNLCLMTSNGVKKTLEFPHFKSFKVIPWWDPRFKLFKEYIPNNDDLVDPTWLQ